MKDSRIPLLLLGVATLGFLGLQVYEQIEFSEAYAPVPVVAHKRPEYGAVQGMTATWYGSYYEGRKTASGQIFNAENLTAAHSTLPFGTRLKIAHEGREVVVTVTDRMPAGPDRIDLSARAFREVAPLARGVIRVAVRREVSQ